MTEAANPYAAPAARVDDVAANPEAEKIRREHITHEASIKAIGFLFYLGGALLGFAGVAGLLASVGGGADEAGIAVGLGLLALGAGEIAAGWGVRGLKPWGRIVGIIVSCIGLLGFPIGTLISAYFLYLFVSKKGRTVFTPEYKDVIAATPHVVYRTSIVVWIFVGLLVALIAAAVLIPMFAGK